jgi:hypothetical protein
VRYSVPLNENIAISLQTKPSLIRIVVCYKTSPLCD